MTDSYSIRTILVAVKEPDARTSLVLRKAGQLAEGLGARLELFHAMTWPIYANSDRDYLTFKLEDRDRVLRRLQLLAARLGARLGARHGSRIPQITVAAEWDRPAYEAVVRRAVAIHADLVIAERHVGRHFAPSVLHFNDWELLRQCPVPLLIVKQGGLYKRPALLAAVDPTHSMDKPARLDDRILKVSAAVAAALKGQLHAVHALEVLLDGMSAALGPEDNMALNRRIVLSARTRYQRLMRDHKIPGSRQYLLKLSPGDAISYVAAKLRCSVVVLGAISRSGWQRLIIGNTAETLLDRLPCDVLIVKPQPFRTRVPRRLSGARFVPTADVIIG